MTPRAEEGQEAKVEEEEELILTVTAVCPQHVHQGSIMVLFVALDQRFINNGASAF